MVVECFDRTMAQKGSITLASRLDHWREFQEDFEDEDSDFDDDVEKYINNNMEWVIWDQWLSELFKNMKQKELIKSNNLVAIIFAFVLLC